MSNRYAKRPNGFYPVRHVTRLLAEEYGPLQWEPRYEPASELVYTILSQHTSDVNSGRAFSRLMDRFRSLAGVAAASEEDVRDAIWTGGLAKIKAPRIKKILCEIYRQVGSYDLSFLGEMPLEDAKEWLKRLPGIGPKSAAVVLCFSLGMPAMPVDTHIYRVAKRLGLIGKKVTVEKAHDVLEGLVPPGDIFPFHVYLISHGRKICKALRPLCKQCVLKENCPSRNIFPLSTRREKKR